MRVLLVYPRFPETFWSFKGAMPLVGRRAAFPPLPLITLAAMLPQEWQFRVADLNIGELDPADVAWADVALITGMIVQKQSIEDVLIACLDANVPSVVGGPFANNSPDAAELALATSIVIGEAEDAEFLAAFVADLRTRRLKPRYQAGTKNTDVSTSPTPRYDLLARDAYYSMQMQVSRGCPFKCEFCDIWVTYGNRPRVKGRAQIEAELDAILATGFRGSVFIVDDNFIGNKKRAKDVLQWFVEWQTARGFPFRFFTEADIRVAHDGELMDLMREAGFESVFIGIESPSKAALAETHKTQNLTKDIDVVRDARTLREHGLFPLGGFILGFDADGPDIFDEMIALVSDAGIYFAMVGLLMALPGTVLETRMRKEGRLRATSDGNNFQPTNIDTVLPERDLIRGYIRVLERLYDPDAYYDRAFLAISQWKMARRRKAERYELLAGVRSVVRQGVLSPDRRAYRRFMARVARLDVNKIPSAFAMAITANHMLTYAREEVLPRLRAYEATLTASAA